MDESEGNVIKAAISWYRYILRSGGPLSIEEKALLNAVFELQNKVKDSILILNKDKQENPYRPYEENDRPTTPAPFVIQKSLIEESKNPKKE